jgi:outer membrane protein
LEVPLKKVSAVFLFLLLSVPVWGQEKVRIGFVDLQKAIRDSQAGKRAREQFQAEIKKIESGLLKEKQDLERLKSDLEKKGLLLKAEERRSMEKEFQRRARGYQRQMKDSREELRQREAEMTGSILKELEKVVTKIGEQEKFTLILERTQVLYTDQGVDITDRVIKSFDRRAGNKVSKPK